ncbi:MAG: hypothetical protein Q4F81_10620 [Eubacteriales bacterium]|nr:hypothetical protein [Eubacteriales bacterium]
MRLKGSCPAALREFGKCAVVFCLSVVVAMGSLLAAAFAPQSRINDNLLDSVDGLYLEGQYPVIGDRKINSLLDNATDTAILRATAGMNRHYLGSVLTNPLYTYNTSVEDEGDYPVKCLELYSIGEASSGAFFYVRYWMGFRAVLRWLLVFFDYYQIKRYVGALFFAMFALVLCSIAKRVDTKTAFAFAVSIILVRPQVIVGSLQFLPCFLIAFTAMLMVPLLTDRPQWDGVFFLEIGIVTMFFDFYTTPLVTVGFPLVYLAVLRARQGKGITLKWMLRCVLIWLAGYALMWLAKLTLTSLLTSVDGLGDGLSAFARRTGIEKSEGYEEYYSLSLAFENLRSVIFSDAEGKVVYLLGVGLTVLTIVICAMRRKLRLSAFAANGCLLFAAVLPFIWFCCTAQPIAIHYWYQYRSIALTHWAVGAYVTQTFWQGDPETRLQA